MSTADLRFAYLVLAHDNLDHLRALTNKLLSNSEDFVVLHVDAKSSLRQRPDFHELLGRDRVLSAPRAVNVHWGHQSQLDATKLLIDSALTEPFDVAHLVSGSCWPVADRKTIAAQTSDRCWIDAEPAVDAHRMDEFRLDTLRLPDNRFGKVPWVRALLLEQVSRLLRPRRSHPWGPWHKGSQWWSLPRDVCETVSRELGNGFRAGRFRGTTCSDEHVIQTIVAASYAGRCEWSRRYVKWSAGQSSPEWLDREDWTDAVDSGAWFARKLHADHDAFYLML